MQKEQKTQFEETIKNMRKFWNQDPLPQIALDVYWDNLKMFSSNQFRIASESLLRTYKVRWKNDFPTPLEFYEAIPSDPRIL